MCFFHIIYPLQKKIDIIKHSTGDFVCLIIYLPQYNFSSFLQKEGSNSSRAAPITVAQSIEPRNAPITIALHLLYEL